MPSIAVLTVSGSLRARSTNTSALEALAGFARHGVVVNHYRGLGDVPAFNPDLDAEGSELPRAVQDLRAQVRQADALVISTPEYAHGIPGSLKNALDWLVSFTDFAGKPVAILDVSPLSLHVGPALAEVLRTMAAGLIEDPRLAVPLPRNRLDAAAMLADPTIAAALEGALTAVLDGAARDNPV